jgi:hypothetical protein
LSDITAHFHTQRIKVLRRIFTPAALKTLWKSVVKGQMRDFDVLDLHDYYDFTRAIDARSKQICDLVLDGRFRASKPLVYRLEKKLGIRRHMTIASPFDALVLQAIVEALRERLVKAQPSKSAYYSRDKHQLKLPHQLKNSPYELWWQLWPKFQKEIFRFSKNKKYLVVSDLTNYYDSLDLRALRTAIVHKIKAPEVLIDLMFTIVEDLGWTPDYLPRRHVGLPVVNLESFRFLAHVFLFDADEVLKRRTGNSFARWMDDINFGVNTKERATETLSDLSDTLKSRGLSLNLAKTQILTSKEALHHFCFHENVALDQVSAKLKAGTPSAHDRSTVRQQLRDSLHSRARNADKITKRSLRLCAELDIRVSLDLLEEMFIERAGFRQNVSAYLSALGYSPNRSKLALQLAAAAGRLDDGAKFAVRDLVLEWDVPPSKHGQAFVKEMLRRVRRFEGEVGFCTALVIYAKFAQPHELLTFIESNRSAWETSNFAYRQVIATMPRIQKFRADKVASYLHNASNSGKSDVVSVAKNFLDLKELKALPPDVRLTLFPTSPSKRAYPVSKFLILKWLFDHGATAKQFTPKQVEAQLGDRWYTAALHV